jgi:hypothetical protein
MRKVLLFVFYIVLVTPVGLVLRVVRDPLRRRLDGRVPSYWVEAASARR